MAIAFDCTEETPLLKKTPTVTVLALDSDSDSDSEQTCPTPPIKSEDSQARQSQLHTEFEHGLDFWKALRVYRPAVFWCVVVNVTVVLNGFDGALMGNLVGVESFKQQFGKVFGEEYIISANWLGAFNYAPMLGAAFGSFAAGVSYDKFGPRAILGFCSFGSIVAVLIQFLSTTPMALFIGQLINGTIVGFFPVVASAYVGEVCPVVLRGVIGSMVNLGFVTGQLLASALLKATATIDSPLAYKIPFAAQWFLPLLILSLLPFMPASPWHLVRQNKNQEALVALTQLSNFECNSQNALSSILETVEREQISASTHTSAPSVLDVFTGPNLRRLIIAIMVFQLQPLSGSTLYISYSVYFFSSLGLSPSTTFTLKLYLTIMGLIGTLLAWPIMSLWGRRPILISGSACLASILFLIGALDLVPGHPQAALYAQSSLLILANFVYDLSTGPLCFVILCEVPSPRLRGVTIAMSNILANATSVLCAVSIPFALNKDEANWGGKIGFVFAAIGAVCTAWCWFCLPESKGRTFEELDTMFEREVPSRKFGEYDVHGFNVEEEVGSVWLRD